MNKGEKNSTSAARVESQDLDSHLRGEEKATEEIASTPPSVTTGTSVDGDLEENRMDPVLLKIVRERCQNDSANAKDDAAEAIAEDDLRPKHQPRKKTSPVTGCPLPAQPEASTNRGAPVPCLPGTAAKEEAAAPMPPPPPPPPPQPAETPASQLELAAVAVTHVSQPGAHAIVGPGNLDRLIARLHGEDEVDALVQERDEEQQAVITGAILVDERMIPALEIADNLHSSLDTPAIDLEDLEAVEEVVEVRLIEASQAQKRALKGWLFLFLLFAVGLLVVLLVFIPRSPSRDSVDALPKATVGENAIPVYPPFRENLPPDIIKGILNTSSARYLANAWRVRDPQLLIYSEKRQWQRFMMVWMYHVGNGQYWFRNDHWLSYNVSECHWFNRNSSTSIGGWNEGMEPEPFCDENESLLVLNISANNCSGRGEMVPHGVNTGLRIYDVSNNNMHGYVQSFGTSSLNLEVFILSNNNYEGQMTGGGGFAALNVRIVKVDGNRLIGHYPYVYKFLPRLEVVNFTGNLFHSFSKELRYCQNLTYFGASNCRFAGTIPSEWGQLPRLREIDVSNNPMVSGTVPSELAMMPRLASLDVSGTAIAGRIPDLLCSKVKDGTLAVYSNCTNVECCNI